MIVDCMACEYFEFLCNTFNNGSSRNCEFSSSPRIARIGTIYDYVLGIIWNLCSLHRKHATMTKLFFAAPTLGVALGILNISGQEAIYRALVS